VIFIILQNGLYLDNLSIANITVKNLYIKWNDKLNISIDEINIQPIRKDTSHKIDLNDIHKYISYTSQFFLLTESLVIEKLKYKDTILKFTHTSHENGLLILKRPSLTLQSHFVLQQKSVNFTIDKLSLLEKKIDLHGNIILNLKEEKLYSKLDISINNDAEITFFAIADKTKLSYSVKSHKNIQHIHQLVALFHLPKGIKFWTMDAIDAPSLTIHTFKGFLEYDKISSAYKNLYVTASLNKLNYTYNPKLDAIHTKKTELEFKDGILYIRPKNAYSYGMYLNKSWLKIDFTKKEELLTLYLLFNGKLNKDMLHILAAYNIKLPFLQHSGNVKTNLKIAVNLRTIKIDAHGTFFTKKANFDYLGLNIDITDTLIKLDNYNINITKMKANYKDIAQADVTVQYNAKKAKGNINFIFKKIHLNKNIFLKKQKQLHAIYKISPKGDTIFADKSYWSVNDFHVILDPLRLPFDLKALEVKIPTTYVKADTLADGFITGKVKIKDFMTDLKIDLLHFNYKGIHLTQSDTQLDLTYKKALQITSKNNILFAVNGSQYKIEKLQIKSDSKSLSLKKTKLFIGEYINTQIDASYLLKEKKADIRLTNFIVINPNDKTIVYYNNQTKLALLSNKEQIQIYSKELDADFILQNKKWELNINNIALISKDSKFLQQFNITNGSVHLYKNSNDEYTRFTGNTQYKYKLLTDQNKAISDYKFSGYITKEKSIYCTINKNLTIKIAKQIKINLKNSGIMLEDLLSFLKDITPTNSKDKKEDLNILFNAKNSYIYVGNNRYILADTINLQHYKGITTAQLYYAKGKASFKLQDQNFHLYGENFNGTFMDKLFSLSKFTGGSLDFSLKGTLSEYDGTFFIKDTRIHDYVLLNNILAFINTIPSLATFSLPGYAKNGLHIDNAYMKFHLKNHIFTISDIYIGSKEIKILGKGTASVKYDTIDLALNLKTDIGSHVSKIPLVGYLIFDGKSLSTSLKISGKLTDPKVETMLARDIIVAPLNIIQRTLTLPYKFLKNISSKKE